MQTRELLRMREVIIMLENKETLLVDNFYKSLHIKPKGEKSVTFSVPFSFVTGLIFITQGQDITVTKFEHMAAMIKHQDVVLTSGEWKIVLNIDTDQYDQSLDKLTQPLLV
jgi:hypothetical protein